MHLAEIGTTLASGASHWRFGNVDWKVVRRIGVPGAIGAFAGATFLRSLSTEIAAPGHVRRSCWRSASTSWSGSPSGACRADQLGKPLRTRFLAPLGLFAGFVDATGGGGWGPVATPALLASGRMEPRQVIGSVDTSESSWSVAASIGFLIALGSAGITLRWVAALLVGGLVAAPIAAWLVRHIPGRGSSARWSAASSC